MCTLLEKKDFDGDETVPVRCVRPVLHSRSAEMGIWSCEECSQLFLVCLVNVQAAGEGAESWRFWAPITVQESQAIQPSLRSAVSLLESRRHLVMTPSGELLWRDAGVEMALSLL